MARLGLNVNLEGREMPGALFLLGFSDWLDPTEGSPTVSDRPAQSSRRTGPSWRSELSPVGTASSETSAAPPLAARPTAAQRRLSWNTTLDETSAAVGIEGFDASSRARVFQNLFGSTLGATEGGWPSAGGQRDSAATGARAVTGSSPALPGRADEVYDATSLTPAVPERLSGSARFELSPAEDEPSGSPPYLDGGSQNVPTT